MVFASLLFLYLFLPLNLILYFSTQNLKLRNWVLIIFSLFFYAWGEPIWFTLLIISSLVDYYASLWIGEHVGKKKAVWGVVFSLIANLGLLATFKYSDFFVENVNLLLGTAFTKPGIGLPIGISFYTFQTISYTIDVFKGEVAAQRHFSRFLMYVSLYPQLVAGPIVRYQTVEEEINYRTSTWEDFSEGVNRFLRGLFKKVFFANVAGELAAPLLNANPGDLTTAGAWFGIVLFSLQIYFDFSGYSDMAIGLGRMYGFKFLENFNYPYIAQSVTDFWRRWHMSLGTFFRDYVYIPLGGNRKHQWLNIGIVWLLTGLWHGPSWNFVLWGAYYGILLVIEKLFLLNMLKKMPGIIGSVYTLFAVLIGWTLFNFVDFNQLFPYLQAMFSVGKNGFWDFEVQALIFSNGYWLAFALIACMPIYPALQKMITQTFKMDTGWRRIQIVLNILFLLISTSLLVGNSFNPFLYFRF
jgi:alginate O-acetyltransferase complex protein AlgI